MSFMRSWLVVVGAALVFAAPTSAQQVVSANADVVPAPSAVQVTAPAPTSSIPIAPTWASTALSVHITPLTAPVALTPRTVPAAIMPLPVAQGGQSKNVAMMIVGGAAMVVGSLIDGDTGTIVMIGGGVVGLIGLFRYLR